MQTAAQKIDGTGRIHLTTLGRRGGRVLTCTGRTMYDLIPASGLLVVDCAACLKKAAR